MLRSDLSDYSDAYNGVKRNISVKNTNAAKKRNKKLGFKKNTHLDHAFRKLKTHL